MTPVRLSPSGPVIATDGGPRLFAFDILGGPVVPPSSLGSFLVETDSFTLAEAAECAWWATVPAQPDGSVQFLVSVQILPPTLPGATAQIRMTPANIDPAVAATTGPFRLVLALYSKPATPGNIVPP